MPRGVGDLEAEVGGGPGNVPVAERITEKVARQVVGDPRIDRAAGAGPGRQEVVQRFERHEEMLGRPHLGPGARERAHGIDEIGRRVGGAALFARIAVLVGGLALRAGALHEPVGEEHAGLRVVELLHVARDDQPPGSQPAPDLAAEAAVRVAVGGAVVVERDMEAGEVGEVGLAHRRDQFPLRRALGPRPDHDRGAVRVVGAEIDAALPAEFLKPDEDIGLDVLDQVPEVDVTVGVGQGRRDEDAAGAGGVHAVSRTGVARGL